MHIADSIKKYLFPKKTSPVEMPAEAAYDIWAATYDNQPENLMLALDELIFSALVKNIDLEDKKVADIGCGTGRHWPKLLSRSPTSIAGFDVSAGMLQQLKIKYPFAEIRQTGEVLPVDLVTESMDCIVSTLTIAHIKNLEEAAASWARLLKKDGDLLITDFHPALLASGGTRSFKVDDKLLSVKNHVHPLDNIKKIFSDLGFRLVETIERNIDETVKDYYTRQNALQVYNRFYGMPVIYGLHFKKAKNNSTAT